MIRMSLEGYDLHVMAMIDEGDENFNGKTINGLVIFK
jgi:hypothetical protein